MNELVFLKNEEAFTNSIKVADAFNKRHDSVLRSIDNLHKNVVVKKRKLFRLSSYVDAKGESRRLYEMNRQGFELLVMGFTGEKAIQWKIRYSDAFDSMEKYIRNHAIEIAQRRTMTDMIRDSGENTRMHGFGYKQYTDLIYKMVTGKTAAQHRKELGLKSGENVKPYMTPEQIEIIGYIEYMVSGMVGIGIQYPEIKDIILQLTTKNAGEIQC